jgi:ATP-dependent Clp protease ATP-binding subunit ClpA
VVFFARYEASASGSAQIETHHLLLGLMREDRDLFAPYLNLETEAGPIRDELTRRFPRVVETGTHSDMPLSRDAQAALAYASEEADRLAHQTIVPAHLLIALARMKGGVTGEILDRYGMNVESLRELAMQRPVSVEVARKAAAAALEALPQDRYGAATDILAAMRQPDVRILVRTRGGEFTISFGNPDQMPERPI